jgi:hypothetical protein
MPVNNPGASTAPLSSPEQASPSMRGFTPPVTPPGRRQVFGSSGYRVWNSGIAWDKSPCEKTAAAAPGGALAVPTSCSAPRPSTRTASPRTACRRSPTPSSGSSSHEHGRAGISSRLIMLSLWAQSSLVPYFIFEQGHLCPPGLDIVRARHAGDYTTFLTLPKARKFLPRMEIIGT